MSKNRPARTREEWLREAIRRFRPMFAQAGIAIPKDVRISIGFGSTGARQENAVILGVCYVRSVSDSGVNEIFISPEHAETVEMLTTVAHELIHAVDDCQSGHRGAFTEMARAIGFEGKMTETPASPELALALAYMAHEMGAYPGSPMHLRGPKPVGPIASGPKGQGTRMIKRSCQLDPELPCYGYSVRLTAMWLEIGNPHCPNGHEMMA